MYNVFNMGIGFIMAVEDKDVELFLNPTRNDFHDPYLMPDMRQAVDRIVKAIENKEKTMIYGDYDVDGITSITVLSRFFKERGLDVGAYIPNRLDEGYGLNKDAIKQIADDGYKLIITVDCGISGMEEIKYAYELGLSKAVSEMTQAEKQQLRMIAILDQSRVSWGDLANTLESPSNLMRQFKNNLKETGMVLGQLFLPILQKVLPKHRKSII